MIVCGSPRKNGNTNTIVNWCVEGMEEKGAEVEIVHAADLQYKELGCIACMGCKRIKQYRCVIEDEVSDVVAKIPENNVLVFATPVYFFGPTGQLKLFIDRMYSLLKFNPEKEEFVHPMEGIQLGLIATSGGPEDAGLSMVEGVFETLSDITGIELETFLAANVPVDPSIIKGDEELKEKAREFGRMLAEA